MTGDGPQGGPSGQGPVKPQVGFKKADYSNANFVNKVHRNTSSDLIMITDDKALICLIRNFDRLKEGGAWKTPLGMLITLLTVMVTAAPQDKFGLPKETWAALGWIATALTGVWLVRDLVRLRGRNVDPHSIVMELKTNTATMPVGGK